MPTKQENGPLADMGLASREVLRLAYNLIAVVADKNDPNECIADNGMTVWDGLQKMARPLVPELLAALSAQPAGDATDAEGLHKQLLEEIADGAYGDDPATRGRARDALNALRTHPPKPGEGAETELKTCPFCMAELEYSDDGDLAGAWFHPGVVTDTDCLLSGKGFRGVDLLLWNMRAIESGGAPVVNGVRVGGGPARRRQGEPTLQPRWQTEGDTSATLSRTSQANEGEIERLIDGAAWIYAAEEFDEDRGETPEGWFAHCRRNVADGMGAVHFGDCTNQCQTCIRCLADGYLARARQALSPSPDAEGEG